MRTTRAIHQCPRCDLRFATSNELGDHLVVDHPSPVDDDTVGAACQPPPPRVLVVFESMFSDTRRIAEAVAARPPRPSTPASATSPARRHRGTARGR